MKKFVVLFVAGLLAVPALAQMDRGIVDRTSTPIYADGQNGVTITGEPTDGSGDGGPRAEVPRYSNMALGTNYSVQSALTGGVVSYDDYDSTGAGNYTVQTNGFKFVGGVNVTNGILFFTWFVGATPGTAAFFDSFGIQLPQAGNYIWTISFTAAQTVPNTAFLQMYANDSAGIGPVTRGTWFANALAPTVGTTSATYPPLLGGGVHIDHKFEFNEIPEPTTLALLGLGALALLRRR